MFAIPTSKGLCLVAVALSIGRSQLRSTSISRKMKNYAASRQKLRHRHLRCSPVRICSRPRADALRMPTPQSRSQRAAAGPPPSGDAQAGPSRVALLTDRQRSYLRLVLQNLSSKEIAAATGCSHRAVDKQLLKANGSLGVATRFDAARLLAQYETGVEPLPPANALPSTTNLFPLPPAWPTDETAANTMNRTQVALWVAIIAIVTPLGLTAAGMAIVTLLILLGLKPL